MGQYNVTGNETCATKSTTNVNSFPLVRYFLDSDQHTVVVIIENELGKNVSSASINIYKGKWLKYIKSNVIGQYKSIYTSFER